VIDPLAGHSPVTTGADNAMITKEDVSRLSTEDLLSLWSRIMSELRTRDVIRSSNNPVGDYAEGLVTRRFGLTLEGNSTSGFDAVDAVGHIDLAQLL